jgi:hypothetical protein
MRSFFAGDSPSGGTRAILLEISLLEGGSMYSLDHKDWTFSHHRQDRCPSLRAYRMSPIKHLETYHRREDEGTVMPMPDLGDPPDKWEALPNTPHGSCSNTSKTHHRQFDDLNDRRSIRNTTRTTPPTQIPTTTKTQSATTGTIRLR